MSVQIQTDEQKYQFLVDQIKQEMAKAFTKDLVQEADLLAFAYIFQNVSNYWELRLFIKIFVEQFSFLRQLDEPVREIMKGDVELFLQKKMPALLKVNPDKVIEISKFAAGSNVDLATLLEKFPELIITDDNN